MEAMSYPRKIRLWTIQWIAPALLIAIATCACDGERISAEPSELALGRKLFADPQLSLDGQVSCATCHDAGRFFTDRRTTSIGVHRRGGTRNSPSLLDVGAMRSFFWDGRETRLEDAVLQPLSNSAEMGLTSAQAAVAKITADPSYAPLLERLRGDFDEGALADALSGYLRSLPPVRSRYDLHATNTTMLSPDERDGLALFQGKAACSECHRIEGQPASFTDHRFHHAGIGFERAAGAVAQTMTKLTTARARKTPIGELILADPQIAELGRFAVTQRPEDLGAFRTPTLRNIANTAPYMHDGSIATLQEAVEREIYYRSLARGRPISLTVTEQRQLLAFLQALSAPADDTGRAAHAGAESAAP